MGKKKNNKVVLIAFGSIFFFVGSGFFYGLVLSELIEAWQMQSWHSTQGQLIEAKVTSHQSRNEDNSYTTLYKVKASYQFQVDQKHYTGDRPTISRSSTSAVNDHKERLNKIKQQQSRFNYVVVWYDPSDPSQSVILKNIDWKMTIILSAFCSIFMLIGGAIVIYGVKQNKKPLNETTIDPRKPWTTRPEWASPVIYSNAKGGLKLSWFLFLLSVCVFGTFSLVMYGESPFITGLAVLFGLIPLLVLKRALRLQREWNQFKQVALYLKPYPGVIGGVVSGEIIIPIQLRKQSIYQLSLNCINYYSSGTGDEESVSQSTVVSIEQSVQGKAHLDGSQLKFCFNVSAEHPASSAPGDNYFQWLLSIKTADRNNTFNREYEIPVFITDESQTVAEELKAQPLKVAEKTILEKRLSVTKTDNAISLKTPGSKSGILFASVGGFFAIIGISIAVFSQPFFGIVFAIFGFLFFLLGLAVWGKNCDLKASANGCEVKIYWFNYLIKEQILLPHHISEIITYQSSARSSPNGKSEIKYGLKIITKFGAHTDIGGEFSSRKNATHMKQEIDRILNL